MPQILYSVEVDAMDPDELPLENLHAIERLGSHQMGETIRLTAASRVRLYGYVLTHWGDAEFAFRVAYEGDDRRPYGVWQLAR